MTEVLRVGEHGKTLKVETGQDLSSYPLGELSILVKKPDGTTASWGATSVTDGEDTSSVINYVIQDGDLSIRGNYILHSQVDSTSPNVKEIGEPTVLTVLALYEQVR